jgi:Phytanoyl-CoA dioxygenase (PhyH)
VGRVDELADSSGLVRDHEALRGRLAADGYLFFRGLLPAGQVQAAGSAVAARLRDGGWLTARGAPAGPPRAAGPRDAVANPAYRAALLGADFNRIPYLPALRGLVRGVLGAQAFSYPVKVLRAVYPESSGQRNRGRYVHYDYGGSGVQDMLTSWIPLMDIPVRLGGLAVQPGGHRRRPQLPRMLRGTERGWATTGYRVGDVIIFHSLTPHAALPNNDSALRISGDFRWQLPDQRVPAEFVLGPGGRGGHGGARRELFSRLFGHERWWEPIPAALSLYPKRELITAPPGPSQFFAVHPGWRHWRPPPGEVH